MNGEMTGKYTCVLRVAQIYVTNASNTQVNNRTHLAESVTLLVYDAGMKN